jgi:hypothetical protein
MQAEIAFFSANFAVRKPLKKGFRLSDLLTP